MHPSFEEQRMGKRRYITGFDGLRAIAVIGVIVYHLLPATLQGGYLGVPIFLLLTGYLITSSLVGEISRTGTVKVVKFYIKRIKRLYPVLITMLVVSTAYITLFQRVLIKDLRSVVVTNLLWVYNWWEIGHGQSYFDRFAGESPFTHMWTLSIEGQFYFVWPLVLLALFAIIRRKSIIKWIVLGLAVVSAILMAIMYDPANINRAYYGSDTRSFAIFLGAWLAMVWPVDRLKQNINRSSSRVLDITGIICLVIVLVMYFQMSGESPFTYYGGMFIFTIFSMILMAVIAHPGGHMNAVMTNPVFKWIGQRSYGIYVYQYPVMIFYESQVKSMGAHPFINALIELAIILLISEVSYRLVEEPLRNYNWNNLTRDVRHIFTKDGGWKAWTGTLVVSVLTILFIVGMVIKPQPPKPNQVQSEIDKSSKQVKEHNAALQKGQPVPNPSGKKQSLTKKYGLTKSQVAKAKQLKVSAIGDSVMADSAADLQEVMPKAYVNAQVGRQGYQSPQVIEGMAKKGQLNHIVVINLGTNGALSSQTISQILSAIGSKRQVYWITAHVPTKNWQNTVNNEIKQTAKKHKNVHVVDWHKYSANHVSWFASDGVHPSDKGNIYFTRLVVKEILKDN
ncbi:acyltransferase family protein [Paucilactobacillus suebicus]|uniref:Acyltransferase n=1 Tax=Paucilactobacillus suebicus DSM 5007 = KCTC 3549 TaxID=1423807 RepID=A0A0R1W6K4_9LACO|nr:acyltransferase family protein [Paucilactobacillus suebicus]KRM13552.1 acyltransferase [Paucilactobacillus suebicus DSM 5007 = KCTC 3549]